MCHGSLLNVLVDWLVCHGSYLNVAGVSWFLAECLGRLAGVSWFLAESCSLCLCHVVGGDIRGWRCGVAARSRWGRVLCCAARVHV